MNLIVISIPLVFFVIQSGTFLLFYRRDEHMPIGPRTNIVKIYKTIMYDRIINGARYVFAYQVVNGRVRIAVTKGQELLHLVDKPHVPNR